MARKPLVALVGRPNVGKSTLFNRLVGMRYAVTDEIPGTTRDRLQAEADWRGVVFNVVDTGGIEVYEPKGSRDPSPLAEGSAGFVPLIRAQAMAAVEDADVIVMVTDVMFGVTAADEEVAQILRRTQKPVFLAVNKADDHAHNDGAAEFYSLGVGEVFAISAIHGLGVGDLLDAVVAALRDAPLISDDEGDAPMRVTIVGRPNVGKSSLLNRLLGEDRAIVSPLAGTTRDAIDTRITWHGQEVVLVDTAGIRKRGKIEPGVERYSVLRALKALDRSDVALLLIDATEGITEQDQHIAGYILEARTSVVVVINKWDALDKDNTTMLAFEDDLRGRLGFLPQVPVVYISALTGQRIHQVLEVAHEAWQARSTRIPTHALNTLVREMLQKHPPPQKGTKRLKILFAQQVAVNPPVLLFHVNDTRLVHFSYKRFLENRIREAYPFVGTPIVLSFRPRDGALDEAHTPRESR